MFTAKVRKAIYALSAVLIPLLIVLGVEEQAAAAWVAAGVAVANLAMAFLNVPGDADG
jgi:C4-dicarboxylate transporter